MSEGLDKCVQLLKGPSAEHVLAGLSLLTKLTKGSDEATLTIAFNAIGGQFFQKALGQPLRSSAGGKRGFGPMAMAVLSTCAQSPNVCESSEALSCVPFVCELIKSELAAGTDSNTTIRDAVLFLYLLVANGKACMRRNLSKAMESGYLSLALAILSFFATLPAAAKQNWLDTVKYVQSQLGAVFEFILAEYKQGPAVELPGDYFSYLVGLLPELLLCIRLTGDGASRVMQLLSVLARYEKARHSAPGGDLVELLRAAAPRARRVLASLLGSKLPEEQRDVCLLSCGFLVEKLGGAAWLVEGDGAVPRNWKLITTLLLLSKVEAYIGLSSMQGYYLEEAPVPHETLLRREGLITSVIEIVEGSVALCSKGHPLGPIVAVTPDFASLVDSAQTELATLTRGFLLKAGEKNQTGRRSRGALGSAGERELPRSTLTRLYVFLARIIVSGEEGVLRVDPTCFFHNLKHMVSKFARTCLGVSAAIHGSASDLAGREGVDVMEDAESERSEVGALGRELALAWAEPLLACTLSAEPRARFISCGVHLSYAEFLLCRVFVGQGVGSDLFCGSVGNDQDSFYVDAGQAEAIVSLLLNVVCLTGSEGRRGELTALVPRLLDAFTHAKVRLGEAGYKTVLLRSSLFLSCIALVSLILRANTEMHMVYALRLPQPSAAVTAGGRPGSSDDGAGGNHQQEEERLQQAMDQTWMTECRAQVDQLEAFYVMVVEIVAHLFLSPAGGEFVENAYDSLLLVTNSLAEGVRGYSCARKALLDSRLGVRVCEHLRKFKADRSLAPPFVSDEHKFVLSRLLTQFGLSSDEARAQMIEAGWVEVATSWGLDEIAVAIM